MDDLIPTLIFGACLIGGGTWALIWHIRTWRAHQSDATLTNQERRYYRRQYSRRLQATGLIVLIGILLPIGNNLIPWQNNPTWFAPFWMIVLGLAVWVLLLGFGDLLSTRTHSRDALDRLRKLREQQRELEEEVARLKAQSSAGRSPRL